MDVESLSPGTVRVDMEERCLPDMWMWAHLRLRSQRIVSRNVCLLHDLPQPLEENGGCLALALSLVVLGVRKLI